MGFKKTREGAVTHVGRLPVHQYEDRDGVETCTGLDHMVQVVVQIKDGPDAGREVRVVMTLEDAEGHRARIADAIENARQHTFDDAVSDLPGSDE